MASREGRTLLKDMNGSGDYVFVIATVTKVWDLPTNKPYQKGYLTDPSKPHGQKRFFVIYDREVRLEEGTCYKLCGKDYGYERRDEVQLLLDNDPYVEALPKKR